MKRMHYNPLNMEQIKEYLTINNVRHVLAHIDGTSSIALLFVHGGPGEPNRHKIEKKLIDLRKHSQIFAYDERGSLDSCPRNYKDIDYSPNIFASDLIEIASYIKKKYNYEIVLIGESWGSFISSLAISSRPDLFKAYIGYGQLYSMKETIKWQKEAMKDKFIDKPLLLKKLNSVKYDEDGYFLTQEDSNVFHSLLYPHFEPRSYKNFYLREIKPLLDAPCYEKEGKRLYKKSRIVSSIKSIGEHEKEIELPNKLKYEIPYFIFQGKKDFITPYEIALKRFQNIEAPKKEFVTFERSFHLPAFDENRKFMNEVIRVIKDL